MAKVLVTGATGNIGARVVAGLRDRDVPVRAFVRDPERARARLGAATELAHGDFAEPDSLRRAVDGADRLFLLCANDPRQVEFGTNAVDAAVRAGVERVVMLSTIGAAAGSPTVFFDQHGRLEDHVRASGIPSTVLRAAHLMSNILGSAPTIRQAGRFFLPAGDAPIAMVDPRDVAAAAVAALAEPAGAEPGGRTYELTGPAAITYGEVAERLTAAVGRPVEYVPVPDEAAVDGMVQAGLPQWLAEQVVEVFRDLRTGTHGSTSAGVRSLTGHEPRAFEDFAHAVVAPALDAPEEGLT
ncbi:SDR family oxidoreductase [Streptomyces sp. NPDC012637]|uniref:SDR family oxidoreductase n=1 Tax=Streptomyces sp. NPDC012637 TaxID=3364842 RepID=UPI0036E27A94